MFNRLGSPCHPPQMPIFEVGLKVGGEIMMEGLDGSLIWPENEMLEGFPAALKHTVDEAD